MKDIRALHLVGATSGARTEWLGDREYLVVPTVALIGDNVIHAVNAPEAEFVPARILSAEGWERKPLMLGHPTRNGRQISANDPAVLAASSFGFTANPVLNGKRLGVESWCDVKKLEALGQQQLLADLRAGKPVEVSTGSFVETRPASGTANGKRYATEWASIGPDHLAFLPGGVGACSIEMGCGAHRAAMRVMEGSDELREEDLRDLNNPEGINQYTSGGGRGSGDYHVIHEPTGRVISKHQTAASAGVAAQVAANRSGDTHSVGREGTRYGTTEHVSTHDPYTGRREGSERRGPMSRRAEAKGVVARLIRALRDIPQSARDKMPDSDFAGKGTSFPIRKPADVASAAASIGRAGADNYSTDRLKANIVKIAKRKGAAFVAQLPQAWRDEVKAAEMRGLDNPEGINQYTSGGGGKAAEHTTEKHGASTITSMRGKNGQMMHIVRTPTGTRVFSKKQDAVDHASRFAKIRGLDNPEGINQYTSGGGKGADPSKAVVQRRSENNVRVTHPDKPGHMVSITSVHSIMPGPRGQQHSDSYHVRHFGPGQTYKQSTHVSSHETLPKAVAAAKEHLRNAEGADMNPINKIKARILALFDSPEQAASEEAAELIAYKTMRELLDQAGSAWDEMSALVDDLIADEEENPTATPGQEQAEEEIETARLEAVSALCASMFSTLSSLQGACVKELQPDLPEPSDPRYAEALRVAVGARNSAADMKYIQSMHDSSVALGADCGARAAAAMKECPECDGTGQITKDGKQMDCPACDGEGMMRSAEDGGQSAEGGQMTKEQRAAEIKKLVDCPCSGFTAADVKVLEAADDATIERFRAAADARKKEIDDLKAAQAKTEADLKAAQAAQIPAEELTQLRALADERKAKDAAEKADIVAKLVPLKTLSKEQLEAKTLDELRTLAAFAKVPTADFSAKGIPTPRAAAQTDSYAPPDPYNLKALQGKKEAVN